MMMNCSLKVKFYMDINGKEKILLKENYNMKENIYIIENIMEKDMTKKEI